MALELWLAERRWGTMLKILAVAGAAVIVLAGVGGALFESAAASARDAQTTAGALLKKVDSDTKLIDSTLQAPKLPDLTGQTVSHPDFRGNKRTLDEYVTRIDHTTSFVAPDLVELRSTDARLRGQSGNPLAFPTRSDLDQLRRRVASMLSGPGRKPQAVDQLAHSSNNPIQLELGISNLRRVLGDFQSYLQAAERNDTKTIKALDAKLSSESK